MLEKPDKTTAYIRPPIVTVMGHVDHGKTSILDAIRHTNVAAREYGGITQHIGAYQVIRDGRPVTFIDTPGHEAFSQMRERSGKAADIVVLVVAADDGVMPQTKEAISHAKTAKASIVVALNKVDLPSADPGKVKEQLAREDVLVESWGGDVVAVEVSAKTGDGIDKLLDAILAVADLLDIRADPNGEFEAVIVEASLDRKRGVVASAIVRNGTLRVGDEISASGFEAKVKSLTDDKGVSIKEAGPSIPVEILGFKRVPHVGDLIVERGSELVELSISDNRVEIVGQETSKTVSIIIKADTRGTLEAVKASLAKLVTSSATSTYSIKFLLASTGDISESDVLLSFSTGGAVIGFNVKMPPAVEELAKAKAVPVRIYKTIYELVDEVRDMLEGVATFEIQKIKGRAQVLKVFGLSSGDVVAGCKVLAGALKEGAKVAVYDKDPEDLRADDSPLYTGKIKKLKQGKSDVSVVGKDNECGVLLRPQFAGIGEGMFVEVS